MSIPTCDNSEATVLARIMKYAQDNGATLPANAEFELAAMLAGYANAADRAAFNTLANQYRIVALAVADMVVYDPTRVDHSLKNQPQAIVEGFTTAVSTAMAFAESQGQPMVAVDGNNVVVYIADELGAGDDSYAVKVTFDRVKDPQGVTVRDIADDDDVVDSGHENLRAAYFTFLYHLEDFRRRNKHVGSVLFIQKEGEPRILYREIV